MGVVPNETISFAHDSEVQQPGWARLGGSSASSLPESAATVTGNTLELEGSR